jgi:putative phage-type endonuclease
VKPAVRLGTYPPGSPEWHAARASRLGASEIAAVLGLSPWESRFSLWHRKAGIIPPVDLTEDMYWGTVFEAPIAERFAELHPELTVQRTGTWVSSERTWQLANPDRMVWTRPAHGPQTRVPLEVKWSPNGTGWGPTETDEIPVYYRCQVLQQLDVLGAPFGFVVALVGGELREYSVEYDPDDVAVLRQAGAEFMASLPSEENPAGVRPDLDDSDHTYRVLKALHPGIDGQDAEIDPELARYYRAAGGFSRLAEQLHQRAKNRLLDAMGTARRAVCDGERIAIRSPGQRGITKLTETKPPVAGQRVRDAA